MLEKQLELLAKFNHNGWRIKVEEENNQKNFYAEKNNKFVFLFSSEE